MGFWHGRSRPEGPLKYLPMTSQDRWFCSMTSGALRTVGCFHFWCCGSWFHAVEVRELVECAPCTYWIPNNLLGIDTLSESIFILFYSQRLYYSRGLMSRYSNTPPGAEETAKCHMIECVS